jgi:hypothetical protein
MMDMAKARIISGKKRSERRLAKAIVRGEYWLAHIGVYVSKIFLEQKLHAHQAWVDYYNSVLKAGPGRNITYVPNISRSKLKR